MRILPLLLFSLAALGACTQEKSGELRVTDALAYAPITENAPGVAYFTLSNDSDSDMRIHAINSRLFARAEMHETRIANGQSSMRAVTDLQIGAGKTIQLQPGGLHLMLMQAHLPVSAGELDTLTIEYNTNRTVVVEVTLQDRLATPASAGEQR